MVGQTRGLISALQKLGAYNQRIPSAMPQTTAALCIVKPFSPGSAIASLFSTHPPLEDRIAALRELDGSQNQQQDRAEASALAIVAAPAVAEPDAHVRRIADRSGNRRRN